MTRLLHDFVLQMHIYAPTWLWFHVDVFFGCFTNVLICCAINYMTLLNGMVNHVAKEDLTYYSVYVICLTNPKNEIQRGKELPFK